MSYELSMEIWSSPASLRRIKEFDAPAQFRKMPPYPSRSRLLRKFVPPSTPARISAFHVCTGLPAASRELVVKGRTTYGAVAKFRFSPLRSNSTPA